MRLTLLTKISVLLLACFTTGLRAEEPLKQADVDAALNAAFTKYKGLEEGANADYIPALAKVDSNVFGTGPARREGNLPHSFERTDRLSPEVGDLVGLHGSFITST